MTYDRAAAPDRHRRKSLTVCEVSDQFCCINKFPIIMVNIICIYISDVPTDSKIKKSPVEHTRQYIIR